MSSSGALQHRIVGEHVLRQVSQVQSRRLGGIDNRAHADDAGEGDALIADVEDVVRRERLARWRAPCRSRRGIRRRGRLSVHRHERRIRHLPQHVHRTGEDRPCRSSPRRRRTRTRMPPPGRRADLLHRRRRGGCRRLPARSARSSRVEHGLVAAAHVPQVLLLRRGVARGEQALDVRPDEHGGHAPVVLAELREQQRLPEFLEGRAPARCGPASPRPSPSRAGASRSMRAQ